MPIITNPPDLPFQSPCLETKPVIPCEPLSEVIARNPAPVAPSERLRTSSGHARQVAAAPNAATR
jgi:hypothetical protein